MLVVVVVACTVGLVVSCMVEVLFLVVAVCMVVVLFLVWVLS